MQAGMRNPAYFPDISFFWVTPFVSEYICNLRLILPAAGVLDAVFTPPQKFF
jgi:hypothetical protein